MNWSHPPCSHSLSLRERGGVVSHRIKHLRQLGILLAQQCPLVGVDHLPAAHHLAQVVGVHSKRKRMDHFLLKKGVTNVED